MRRSRFSQPLVIAIAGAIAVAAAMGLSVLCTGGQFSRAGLIAVGLAIGIAAFCSLEVAVIALLIAAFTDGFAKGLAPGPVSVLAKDFLLMIGLLRWIWLGVTSQRWESLRLPLILPAFLFTVYCAAEMFNTETASMLVALAGFRSWVIWIPLLVVSYEYLTTRQRVERLLVILMSIAFATGVYGIIQYNIGFDHLYRLSSGFGFYREYGVRAMSTFVQPGAFGDAMSLMAILCIGAVSFVRGKWWLKPLFVLTAAICLVAMTTSGSRAPLLGLVIGGTSLLVLVRRPQFIIGAAATGIIAIVVLNNFAGGAFEARYNPRLVNYFVVTRRAMGPFLKGLNVALERPLGVGVATGTGVGRGITLVKGRLQVNPTAGIMVENEYGRALTELGFPGLFLFVWLLYAVVKGTINSYLRCKTLAGRSLTAACLGIAISTVARLAVGSVLYLAPSGPIFWLCGALAQRIPQIEAAEMAQSAKSAAQDSTSELTASRRIPT